MQIRRSEIRRLQFKSPQYNSFMFYHQMIEKTPIIDNDDVLMKKLPQNILKNKIFGCKKYT